MIDGVVRFKNHWENFERNKLIIDRDEMIKERDEDMVYFNEEQILNYKEKEDIKV